jgi:hypothetical protein
MVKMKLQRQKVRFGQRIRGKDLWQNWPRWIAGRNGAREMIKMNGLTSGGSGLKGGRIRKMMLIGKRM